MNTKRVILRFKKIKLINPIAPICKSWELRTQYRRQIVKRSMKGECKPVAVVALDFTRDLDAHFPWGEESYEN